MDQIKLARDLLDKSLNPLFLTGAGISAESGVPTFRGENGLWKNYRPEELATPEAFRRDPAVVWEWYNWRKSLVSQKDPNAGHLAINFIQERHPEMGVITQNVDGLHQRAGNKNLVELHGNLFFARCVKCNGIVEYQDYDNNSPQCESCGGRLRPHIVWFGEQLDPEVIGRVNRYLQKTDLLVIVGTSGVVYPAAGFASTVALRGVKVIEINPEPVIDFALQLKGGAGEVLPHLSG